MAWPLVAGAVLGGVLGGIGGKARADASKKPTVTKTTVGPPPAELGGYGRINDALDRLKNYQGYRVGQNNPYMGAMGHVMGRAGITPPEGGYQNPYMAMVGQSQGQPQGPAQMQIPPEILEYIRSQMMERYKNLNPGGTPMGSP